MTATDEGNRENGGDDLLAAEYVLGVLSDAERREAARGVEQDAAFAGLVEAWQARLSPLDADYDEVEPPPSVKQALDARLFSSAETAPVHGGWLHSIAFWRALAAAAIALLAISVAVPLLAPMPTEPPGRLAASLAEDSTGVRYLAVYDPAAGSLGLSHVTGDRGQGSDFELWVIEGAEPPVSLGVIPIGATVQLPVSPELRARIAAGALLAISLEPQGGSSTGQPTGPVVATGDLRNI
ncbi:anti-sigma factor [Aquamicrobium sp. LC103]|uniref:anti-sigma factor n=1 Tax=Aquamicrobium sp. LC103 TaxID=1120658 RepID=UPI000B318C14|nr:anti-sigma factor [Aquamicrobium sp. LC103]TKT75013.1 anti-sigma factor [Aquamicrobium sp. LC103]